MPDTHDRLHAPIEAAAVRLAVQFRRHLQEAHGSQRHDVLQRDLSGLLEYHRLLHPRSGVAVAAVETHEHDEEEDHLVQYGLRSREQEVELREHLRQHGYPASFDASTGNLVQAHRLLHLFEEDSAPPTDPGPALDEMAKGGGTATSAEMDPPAAAPWPPVVQEALSRAWEVVLARTEADRRKLIGDLQRALEAMQAWVARQPEPAFSDHEAEHGRLAVGVYAQRKQRLREHLRDDHDGACPSGNLRLAVYEDIHASLHRPPATSEPHEVAHEEIDAAAARSEAGVALAHHLRHHHGMANPELGGPSTAELMRMHAREHLRERDREDRRLPNLLRQLASAAENVAAELRGDR